MSNDLKPETLAVLRKIDVASVGAASPRLLVMVYSHEPRHATACRAQYETWGQRGLNLRFFSDQNDLSLPVVKLPFDGPESYDNLWRKAVAMVRFAHRFLREQFDWFMVGGDDMFLIPENLLR
jgi:glycoprotein-N-acetylgalactosamine 3-beta-galactosyltransferase